MYKIRKDLSISDKDKEILTIEIISKESKNMLISCCYRPPKGITENLTAYLASIFQGVQNEKKKFLLLVILIWVYSSYRQSCKGL